MKNILRSVINFLISLIAFFFIKVSLNKLIDIFNQLYSMWISNYLQNKPKCFVVYPIYLRGGKYISLGKHCGFDQRLRLDAIDEALGDFFSPEIFIGNNVSIQKDCHIGAINKIVIGNNVLLASKVYITDHYHGEINFEAISLPPAQRKLYSKGPVIIEDNVWLGEGVVVLPNVTIGANTIVGANAVVTKSIPKNSVAGGNPARVIRELN
ncbi:DapH/DapD/GlmU-related protein [Flavobacterium sp. 5]|uniref:DapH/DapD/GlmU-related protein n=1 Tax=Flavobacterium sp. 5 TaxID=2035199 RepID=UPI000C2C767A|nr:DapH/DapD/GlmU-related protein [Flavobacterium sp. 5]PKB17430.1 acetyltransferase-like isoleucine patch superfamily enzyme [Flavobacterium sp. 5]